MCKSSKFMWKEGIRSYIQNSRSDYKKFYGWFYFFSVSLCLSDVICFNSIFVSNPFSIRKRKFTDGIKCRHFVYIYIQNDFDMSSLSSFRVILKSLSLDDCMKCRSAAAIRKKSKQTKQRNWSRKELICIHKRICNWMKSIVKNNRKWLIFLLLSENEIQALYYDYRFATIIVTNLGFWGVCFLFWFTDAVAASSTYLWRVRL